MEPPEPLFETGVVIVTPGAREALARAGVDPSSLVGRHTGGIWDELSAADRRENLFGVIYDLQVSSVYTLPTGERIHVITEADRSSTVVMLSEEQQTGG